MIKLLCTDTQRLLNHDVLMYQSIPSLTIPPGQPSGKFLKGRIPHPPGTGKAQNPDPRGRKIALNPHPWGNYFRKSSKKTTKHETEIKKNSTEMLICLEILKQ